MKYHAFKYYHLQGKFVSSIGREKSLLLSNFGKLIAYLCLCNTYFRKSTFDYSLIQQPPTKKVRVLLFSGEILVNLSNQLQKQKSEFCCFIFIILCEIIMYLHEQSQKISHFRNNVLWLGFIDSSQNHCLFQQSSAKIVHILGITSEEIVYFKYLSWGLVKVISWVWN